VLHSPDIDPLAALRELETTSFTPDSAREALPRLLALAASIARVCAFPSATASEPDDDRLLTAIEASELLHVGKNFPYEHQAELHGRKFGAAVRFSRAELLKYKAGTQDSADNTQRDRSGRPGNPMPRRLRTA